MGYYTWYTLEILEDPDNQTKEVCEELNSVFEEFYANDLMNGGLELKWRDWEQDMKALSLKFPKILFKLEGDGEENFDVWIAHFCNGNMNYRQILTYWEAFDRDAFYNENKS